MIFFVELPVHSVPLWNYSNAHLRGRELQPEHCTRSRALAQEIFCIFLSVIHPASVNPAEPVLHTHTGSSGYMWRASVRGWIVCLFLSPEICFKPSPRVLAPKLPLAELLAIRVRDRDGDRDKPSFPPSPPPSLPNSCRHQLPGSSPAAWFRGFLPLVTNVPPCFRAAVQRNKQADCLLPGWVPRHLHSQLVWHRSPWFFSVTPGAIDGRLGLCCCCCTDACSWPTLKGQDIPWFRLAIYCQGCQHLRHSYPAEPSVPLCPPCVPAASPQSELRGAVARSIWRGGLFSSLLLRNVFHLAL